LQFPPFLLEGESDQAVGIKEVHDDIWLVSFMQYDLGYFDLETRVLEPLENPSSDCFSVLLSQVCTVYDGHFDQPKTKRSTRTIPIGTETAEILTAIRPADVDPKALVFATREGLPLERWNLLRKHLKPAAKKLGLPGVTWHLLRHSHTTMLDSVGTPIRTMQSLLGHSTPEITREIYLHAIPEEQRRAVESVERLVFGPKWTQVQASTQTASTRVN